MKVLDKGILELVDVLGSDKTVVNAARISFNSADWYTKEIAEKDPKLIDYLAKHKHISPFYHPQIQFVVRAPISIQRQAYKHKIGTAENSESSRYVEMKREFYVPDVMRVQSKNNKQGSDGTVHNQELTKNVYITACDQAFDSYEYLIDSGVAREQAREILPLATYTSWFWTMSLAACIHFIKLRDEDGAQAEIRAYAKAMIKLVEPKFPVSMKALLEHS